MELLKQGKARKVWHVLFGHLWTQDTTLPESHKSDYLVRENAIGRIHFFYSKCPCGIRELSYNASLDEEAPIPKPTEQCEFPYCTDGGYYHMRINEARCRRHYDK